MQQTPFSLRPRERRPTQNRTTTILSISLLALIFMLIGMGAMFWIVRSQGAFAPTPTSTPTPEALSTETPNVPATIVMEDLLTQVAYNAAQATLAIQALNASQLATVEAMNNAGQVQSPLEQPTVVVMLPSISSGGSNQQPVDPAAETAIAQATSVALLPIISAPQQDSPLATPTETLQPGITVIETPTETATPLATETPTETALPPTATPSPTPLTVTNMSSKVVAAPNSTFSGAPLYAGTGSRYSVQTTIAVENTSLKLNGRNETGEWLWVCCANGNISYWTRSAFVKPVGNPTPVGAPPGAIGDDIRWLPIVGVQGNPQPLPTPFPTPINGEIYPQQLRNLNNNGRVEQLPSSYNQSQRWDGSSAASGKAYVSSLVIANNRIYAASNEPKMYAIDRTGGNQVWATNPLPSLVTLSPVIVDSVIYVGTQNSMFAMRDTGGDNKIWERSLTGKPVTGVKTVGDKLFVGIQENNVHKIVSLDRNNIVEPKYQNAGSQVLVPAIGGNQLFVGGDRLTAFDIDDIAQIVWAVDIKSLVPPVYISPGLKAQAELFAVDTNGQIRVLNANTGDALYQIGGAEGARFLTITDDYIVAVGDGYLRSFQRTDTRKIQDIGIDGGVVLFVASSGNRVVIVHANGSTQLINAGTGERFNLVPPLPAMNGAPAIAGLDLIIPDTDGYLHIVRGNQ